MNQDMKSSYIRFAAMIVTSMIVMFGLMYLNTYEFSDVRWSTTRFYMTFIMGAAMAMIMLSFMRGMLSNKKLNIAIYLGSILVFLVALFFVRSQIGIQDSAYMSAMIPHHSIAILTSERASINDRRVRELADGIIETQRREIKQMNWLLEDIGKNGIASTQAEAEARPVPDFEAQP
jgi:magnesium-transporting ATPase (P-type)